MNAHKKILVIDDEPDLTQMIGFQFKAKGFEVRTAGDGVQALQVLEEFKPDLIILDINMPRMGGIEFYSKICGTDGRPKYSVLVLTARANIQELFQDLDIDGFMIKPFEIDNLVHEAQLIIERKGKALIKRVMGLPLGLPKICIVEHDQKIFNQLSTLMLNSDYTVIPARSGAAGIERIMNDVPKIALVQLGLPDLPGDTVIFRLSQMSKTMEVKFVLYTSLEVEHDRQVMKNISGKQGIITFVEYTDLQDVVEAVKNV